MTNPALKSGMVGAAPIRCNRVHDMRQHPEPDMRTISLFAGQRLARLGPPSRLPTIVPTRSSMLQRLLWAIGIGR